MAEEPEDSAQVSEFTNPLNVNFSVIAEAMTEGVYEWNISEGNLRISPRLVEIIGLGEAELTAEDWNGRIHPDDFEAYKNAVKRHLKAETDRLMHEYRIRRAIGDYLWIADSGRCLRRDNGEAIRLIGAIRDITGRKLAEKRLREAQEGAEAARKQLQDAIESISQGLVMFDKDDRVILFNSIYRGYFAGAAGEEVAAMIKPGAQFWDFFKAGYEKGMFPLIDDHEDFDQYIAMRKRMRKNPQGTIEQHLADGRWFQINEHRTANGGLASVYTDVTELKRREVQASQQSEMLEKLSSRLSKYLSPQVYASIFEAPGSVEVAAQRKKLTVFFSDIVGFTSLVDSLESEELTSLLNQYLTEMSRIATDHGATVDKFMGDAVFAFFGDPVSQGAEEDALACLKMASAMQDKLAIMRESWRDRGIDESFELRVGIATGYCTVGNFGSDDRLDYTAIGNPVNVAARLQSHAEKGGMILDNETYHLVKRHLQDVEELQVTLKGFSKPMTAYKVSGLQEEKENSLRIDCEGALVRVDPTKLNGDNQRELINKLEELLCTLRDEEH